ncbi:hypothetical protein POTOM_035806 [Populus tomentosa]|uniref:Fatty acyl-CoA reductase n=1 Tax=Populus tomentosa TaxID=118781 RepID=A0A8X7YZJ8_POPTO|nr:hypothetical protein POTOM_035806 [Populus tomentosa]
MITAWIITSFLAMINAIFMEKMSRVQPNVKKIYLLSRASGAKSASQRLQNEVHDVALGINTVRAENVICFAKKSVKLKVLVRISPPVSIDVYGYKYETPNQYFFQRRIIF